MVKKRNRRTRKKYKKRGGFTHEKLQACNVRLEEQGVKGFVTRKNMCIESDGNAGLPAQEPAPVQPDQPIAQTKEPTELKKSSGVQSVIAPLEEEPEQPTQPVQGPGVQSVIAPLEEEPKKPKKQKSQNMKDRVSALEKKFGETDREKGRKALRTTVGACRAAVDEKGRKYYYNEAEESTWDPTDEVCHPKDGIEKTGNKSGDCIGARYKGGEEYWYHPTKKFSTHNKNHPDCLKPQEIKAEDIKLPEEPNLSLVRLIEPVDNKNKTPKKTKRKKRKKRRTAKSHQRAASERNRRKQMKENEARKKRKEQSGAQSGGRRRTKRKKSRKRRR